MRSPLPLTLAGGLAEGYSATLGAWSVPGGAPACGLLRLQAFDIATCVGSNILSL